MSSLLVRRLEPEIVERLKQRARAHGRSIEAEHREILRAALREALPGRDLFEMLRKGPRLPQDVDPDDWRSAEPGAPAEL
jgi:hypothetical protein